ncbi:MAG: hypothetical protein QQN63_00340 [Nitrosopumilus sp.]
MINEEHVPIPYEDFSDEEKFIADRHQLKLIERVTAIERVLFRRGDEYELRFDC